MQTDLEKAVDGVIDAAIGEKRIVGTVTLIAQDGETVYQRAAGFADREAERAMREDQLFRLSSITKPIVSAAAMKLIEEGRLGLDDPVSKWLPEFRPRLADGSEPTITVRHLLTHTSGLSYAFAEPDEGPYHRANISDGLEQPGLSIEENLRRIASVPLLSPPGAAWIYSLSLDVLGAIMARAGGASLQDIVRSRVTSPLGMHDTDFSVVDPERLATAYADGEASPVRMGETHVVPFGPGGIRYAPGRALDPNSYGSGGAGMNGSAPDTLRLLATLSAGGAPILSEESVKAMTSDQIAPLSVELLGPGWSFGFGAAVLTDPEAAQTPQSAGTYLWGGVYGHSWFVDPAKKLVVVALTNTAIAGMIGAFPTALRDAVYGALPPDCGNGLAPPRERGSAGVGASRQDAHATPADDVSVFGVLCGVTPTPALPAVAGEGVRALLP